MSYHSISSSPHIKAGVILSAAKDLNINELVAQRNAYLSMNHKSVIGGVVKYLFINELVAGYW